MRTSLVLTLAALATTGLAIPAPGQADRRDRQYPELVLETGGRTATCDILTFTPDGSQLLAVGDDKVVRIWSVSPGGLNPERVLRWPSWREQRGAIYAMDLSPDQTQLAIGGLGMRTGAVMILDRTSGKVLHSLKDPQDDQTIRSIAFTPNGKQVVFGTEVGKVWLWTPENAKAILLGKHSAPAGKEFNRVRFLTFLDGNRFLSVAESGQVLTWKDLTPGQPKELMHFDPKEPHLWYRAALSPDRNWIAAAAKNASGVAVRSLEQPPKMAKDIKLPSGEVPRSIAYSPDGKRLAVGIIQRVAKARPFLIEGDERVVIYDLTVQPPKPVVEFPVSYHAEALAFHPDGKRLAVAGGADHEVTLWDVSRPNPTKPVNENESRGLGTSLWSVGLSQDGQYLGFRDQHDPAAAGPNQRGQGPWRVFDLHTRELHRDKKFEPLKQREQAGGWTVSPDPNDSYVWYAVAPDKKTMYKLPLDRGRDDIPQCYTFLDNPPRLVVGHFWGLSLFELGPNGVRRSRLFTGHQSLVTAVAASADGTLLVSASRDQTISGWSLKKGWNHHAELGAAFEEIGGDLFVKDVDPKGGPAFEAGLLKGDKVITLVVGGRDMIYNREEFQLKEEKHGPKGSVAAAIMALEKPEPGKQLYFRLNRGGRIVEDIITSVRQRPLWRFFPTHNNEWVLWMWQQPFYDTSTNGDSLIGWLVNDRDLDKEPKLYKLDQFRKHFHKPSVIITLLIEREASAALPENHKPFSFDKIEPSAVRIEADVKEVKDTDVTVTLVADPRGNNPDQLPQRVELWLNDYRVDSWNAGGKRFRKECKVKRDLFRSGDNQLTLQVYSLAQEGEARAEETLILNNPKPALSPKLFGLFVGIGNYGQARLLNGKPPLDLRFAALDAEALHERWAKQMGPDQLFAGGQLQPPLVDKAANGSLIQQKHILAGLEKLKQSGPDDLVLLFLSGHGDLEGQFKVTEESLRQSGAPSDILNKLTPLTDKKFSTRGDFLAELQKLLGKEDLERYQNLVAKLALLASQDEIFSFVFCPSDFQQNAPEKTGVTSQMLIDQLAAIKGRKVVLLDTCHSGGILNPIRALTPAGLGPTILASCDRTQMSFEDDPKKKRNLNQGLFTYAILEAFDGKADHKPGEVIVAPRLQEWLEERVPELVAEQYPGAGQTPISFPWTLPEVKLARRLK